MAAQVSPVLQALVFNKARAPSRTILLLLQPALVPSLQPSACVIKALGHMESAELLTACLGGSFALKKPALCGIRCPGRRGRGWTGSRRASRSSA